MSDVAVVDSILGRGERAEVDRDDGPGDREDEEIVEALAGDSAVVGSRPSSRAASPRVWEQHAGFVGVRREVDEEDLEREEAEKREEEDRELMG